MLGLLVFLKRNLLGLQYLLAAGLVSMHSGMPGKPQKLGLHWFLCLKMPLQMQESGCFAPGTHAQCICKASMEAELRMPISV